GQSAMLTETVDSTAPFDWSPFAPLAEGTQLVKCVLSQDEDMTDKPYVSHIELTVELRSPGCSDADTLLGSRTDDSFDVKKLVAFATAGQDSLPQGTCVRVVVTPEQLADTLTLHVFCYASSINDDAQLLDSDGDGLVDADEAAFGTNPNLADTDGDGVPDGVEVHERLTSPLSADTDGDGIGDATDPYTFDHCTHPRHTARPRRAAAGRAAVRRDDRKRAADAALAASRQRGGSARRAVRRRRLPRRAQDDRGERDQRDARRRPAARLDLLARLRPG